MLEEVETSINDGDTKRATDIIGYLIDDIIKFEMAHSKDFLTIGGMGYASQIAVGIALAKPNQKILCIDGDGSLLMHSGVLALNALCPNFVHILINNGVHDSVGAQPTNADRIKLSKLAKEFGYEYSKTVENKIDLRKSLKEVFVQNKSSFLLSSYLLAMLAITPN